VNARLHHDELLVGTHIVRRLVERQFPRFASRPLHRLHSSGSSTHLFRLGDDLLVRLPRQPGGSATVEKEARYLPVVAPALSVRVPTVVGVGQPDAGYPERWSIVEWIDGDAPAVPTPDGPVAARVACELAATVAELRGLPVPPAAATDPALRSYRAGSLRAVDADIRGYLADCRTITDLPLDLEAGERFWDRAVALPDPPADARASWAHGDLLAENLLVRDGHLAAVLDFGGLCVGCPDVDLAGAWELFGPTEREIFRRALAADDISWARGRAWAFAVAVMALAYYWRTLPRRCAHRLVAARAVLADAAL
jgi:aminoglycoside phosphotransferase (APT) family kinase protein